MPTILLDVNVVVMGSSLIFGAVIVIIWIIKVIPEMRAFTFLARTFQVIVIFCAVLADAAKILKVASFFLKGQVMPPVCQYKVAELSVTLANPGRHHDERLS